MTDEDFTADWSPATLRLALAAADAANFRNFSAAMRFGAEAERLAAEMAQIRGTRTANATSIHRDLRAARVTIRRIAEEVGIDQRSVSRILNAKKAP